MSTNKERQKRYRDTRSKVMLPKELKDQLDARAEALAVTLAEEYLRMPTEEIIARFGSKQAVYAAVNVLPEYEGCKAGKCKAEIGKALARLKNRVSVLGL